MKSGRYQLHWSMGTSPIVAQIKKCTHIKEKSTGLLWCGSWENIWSESYHKETSERPHWRTFYITGIYSSKDSRSWEWGKDWGIIPDSRPWRDTTTNATHASEQHRWAIQDSTDKEQNLKRTWEVSNRMRQYYFSGCKGAMKIKWTVLPCRK